MKQKTEEISSKGVRTGQSKVLFNFKSLLKADLLQEAYLVTWADKGRGGS